MRIEASWACFSVGSAAFVMRTADKKFDAIVSCQSASVIASEFGSISFAAAALFTRISSPPSVHAGVPVQTLTEHGLNRECWQAQPRQKEAPDELSPSGVIRA